MARKADYSNTQKYSNRKSFDGQPVPNGKVLVPFLKEKFGLQKGDYDYEYDGETFDIEDTSQPSVEYQVLDKLYLKPTEEELKIKLLAHFDKETPRYAKIIRLSPQGMSIDDICIEINLKSSRGRQEINNAHGAVCEYLRLRHCKKNRK